MNRKELVNRVAAQREHMGNGANKAATITDAQVATAAFLGIIADELTIARIDRVWGTEDIRRDRGRCTAGAEEKA